MKVILQQDIPNLGHKYDVAEVADGYAANYLIPKKLAARATTNRLRNLEEKKQQRAAKAAEKSQQLRQSLEEISGKQVSIKAKTNEQGHLFKGLYPKDISDAISAEYGVAIPAENIELEQPIKETGEHSISVSGDGKESTSFTLTIEADGEK